MTQVEIIKKILKEIKALKDAVKNLNTEVALLKIAATNLRHTPEIPKKVCNEDPGIDAWDPSCSPPPEHFGKKNTTAVAINDNVKRNTHEQ